MTVITNLKTPLPRDSAHPISLTIGTFDGVHLGHQELIKQLKGTKVVLTYSNHPIEVLYPNKKIELITSAEEKVSLIQNMNVDYIYLIPFTAEFAQQTPEEFLTKIRELIPFDQLILGEDATIGANKSGTREIILKLAEKMNFKSIYVPHLYIGQTRPSSRLIRELIRNHDLKAAAHLLGRPFGLDT